jgi:anti-anti-sigma factor
VSTSGQDAVWIRLDGELDIHTTAQLQTALDAALHSRRLIVIDLRGLTFMDSTGLGALISANAVARRCGSRLVLIRGRDQVERLFELTGLTETLAVVDLDKTGALHTTDGDTGLSGSS